MSTHEAKVLPFTKDYIKVHENADKLALYCVPDTQYVCCINKADWLNEAGEPLVNKVVHIEPDSLVKLSKPEFSWLLSLHKDKLTPPEVHRVRAKKLRGINSFGFLARAEDSWEIGENVWEKLELERWQPEEPSDNSQCVRAPQRDFSQYDVENLKKYWKVFEGTQVVGTEKIHGQNMRVCFQEEQIYVGSRKYWVADNETSAFWKSYRSAPGLEKLVKENNNLCVYGESYGNNAGFTYDCKPGERRFRAFDIYDMGRNRWLDFDEYDSLCKKYDIPVCTLLYRGKFNIEHLLNLAEQDSPLLKGQTMEGIVVSTEKESYDSKLCRCKAKIVSCRYFDKS